MGPRSEQRCRRPLRSPEQPGPCEEEEDGVRGPGARREV